MTEHWKNRLAHFDEAPVVDFFGIVSYHGAGGWGRLENNGSAEPDALGFTSFTFDVWRIEWSEVQTTQIRMTAIIPHHEWTALVGIGHSEFRSYAIVHIKAKLAQNPAGYREALFIEWVGPVTEDAELNELQRQLSEPVILNLPPLPTLKLTPDDGRWHGGIALRSWEGFYLQSSPHYGERRGTVFPLSIESLESENPPIVKLGYRGITPSPEQGAAYAYLTENEKVVQDALLQGILDQYPEWQEDYGGDEEYMPDVTSREQFRSLLILWDVSILKEARDGIAYVYWSLISNWDIEHGLAAVMHRDRVVAVGDHDSMWRVSERDAELG